MSIDRTAFLDIARLTTAAGRVPAEIPAEYWRWCWTLRRRATGNKAPAVAVIHARICLPYTPH